jgi:hypothetical protein
MQLGTSRVAPSPPDLLLTHSQPPQSCVVRRHPGRIRAICMRTGQVPVRAAAGLELVV